MKYHLLQKKIFFTQTTHELDFVFTLKPLNHANHVGFTFVFFFLFAARRITSWVVIKHYITILLLSFKPNSQKAKKKKYMENQKNSQLHVIDTLENDKKKT